MGEPDALRALADDIVAVRERAVEVFGDAESAERWLNSPLDALGGGTALDLVRDGWRNAVEASLDRVEERLNA